MAGKKHTHKYHRLTLYGSKIWACALPNCPHYMPKHLEQLVIGKNTICWGCDEETFMSPQNMNLDQPLCGECSKIDSSDIRRFLESRQ